jgi:hypothetical protein
LGLRLGLGWCEGRGVVGAAVGIWVVVGLCWASWQVGVVGACGEGLVICCHCGLWTRGGWDPSSCRLDALEYACGRRRCWSVVLVARGVVICESLRVSAMLGRRAPADWAELGVLSCSRTSLYETTEHWHW